MKSDAQRTLADYVVIAISPMLIMALVGSLVFFLVEVLYVGEYGARMRWILFCFVFGSVLVSRISMETEIADRAAVYGIVLGLLVWIGLQTYVEYAPSGPLAGLGPVINAFLVVVTWWSAHRLTWDCTHIDDSDEASGEGLLHTTGLDEKAPAAPVENKPKDESATDDGPRSKKKGKAKDTDVGGILGWWDRYRSYRDAKKRGHNPGVWVVYFSLAALPLYGVGQSLIPAGDADKRRSAFWLMTVYVGSALGLLLTTCFLGLRRYLRQRNLRMPMAMTGVWLTIGGIMVAVFLLAGALLPRPYAEYSLFDPAKVFGSKERQASKYAIKMDDPGKDEGSPSAQQSKDDKSGSPGSRTRPGNKDQGNQGSSAKGQQKDGSSAGKQQGKQGDGKNKDGARSGKQQDNQANDRNNDGSEKSAASDGDKQDKDSNKGKGEGGKQSGGSSTGSTPTPRSFEINRLPTIPPGITNVIKWVIYVALALVGLWLLLKFLANFTHWARRLLEALRSFWLSLFGGFGRRASADDAGNEEDGDGRRPFSSFRNPFVYGSAERMSPEDLVRYSFEALEAFAFERGLERHAEQTPLEFADRLSDELPALEADARRLAALYSRAAYARGRLPEPAREAMRQFWHTLERASEKTLSPAAESVE